MVTHETLDDDPLTSKGMNTVNTLNKVKHSKHVKHEIQGATAKEVASASIIIDEPRPVGRPKSNHRVITKSTQQGLPDGWTRATITVREEVLEALKRAAYWERKTIKTIIDTALATHLDGKTYDPVPKEL